ncbi:DUF763 domain-containing protein [Telmatobacter sp. DSM 110680]|uniref:DUF763 domain-containing protein n=1 Tax=Telmatobacter sp. DSM 110680 TaxID=3036704 RepID=A0AAU7DRD2_9BACT
MKRSGTADLPLHGGHVPPWLAERMTLLGTAITECVLESYGPSEFLTRISDPFWFQALGCVMGMDWHSSGITTSVMGALKRGLNPRFRELGITICGGRGKHSKRTPAELHEFAGHTGLDGDYLARTSRLTARIDNNAIADGFQLYLHSFVIHKSGEWAVVQQGMNADNRLARRYHWHSAAVRDFVSDPHTAILGKPQGTILNLVDHRAVHAQKALLSIAHEPVQASLDEIRKLTMPSHHDVRPADLDLKRLGGVLAVAHEEDLRNFASLLLVEGLGPRTLQSLALIAEVVHGAPSRFDDPARFSFAHGGKDGHPFPVPLKTYDESLSVLRRALDAAKLGHTEKLEGFRCLDRLTRNVESNMEPLADFSAAISHERNISSSIGGRTVFEDVPKSQKTKSSKQMSLFAD